MTIDYIEITYSNSDEVSQFHDILVEAFPDPYGREDMEILRRNLQSGSWVSADEVCRYHLIVARWENRVVGGASFYFFDRGSGSEQRTYPRQKPGVRQRSQTFDPGKGYTSLGMGTYLAVREDFRGIGIGTKLIAMRDQVLSGDAQEFSRRLKGLIIQVSDPGLMSTEEIEQDSMNPWERERFWKRRGYKKIDFKFTQPSIRKGEPPIEYLSLYLFPYCPQWKNMDRLSRRDLREIIDCFIRCTGTIGPPESDPSYLCMKSELQAQEHFRVL